MEGRNANNDNTRYFVGGTVLQRPGLAMVGNYVVAGFGGHCDNFNYTGMLIAASKTAGVGVTNIQAMVARPGIYCSSPTQGPCMTNGRRGTVASAHGYYRPNGRPGSYLALRNRHHRRRTQQPNLLRDRVSLTLIRLLFGGGITNRTA